MSRFTRTRRLAALATLGILGGWISVWPATAQQAPGDVSQIGGQGVDSVCRDDDLANRANWGDDGTGALGSAKFNYHSFGNVASIAVGGGNVFVPDRSVVRSSTGTVAGVAPGDPPPSTTSSTVKGTPRGLTGAAAEGANPRAVALEPIAVAVAANGSNLYILESASVRHVNLVQPAIHTIAGAAVGTPFTAGTGSSLAADQSGNVFIGDAATGALYRLSGNPKVVTRLATLSAGSIAVDAGGTALYGVTGEGGKTVSRINPITGAMTVVAGGGTSTSDGVAATSASLTPPLAVAVDPLGGHLYIADGTARVRKVDLTEGTINTVVGSGQGGYQAAGKAASFTMNRVKALAVDLFGSVYMLVPDDCAVFMALTPALIFTPPPPSNPPAPQPPPTTPPGPTGQDSTNTGGQPAPEAVGTPNQGAAPQQGAAPINQTQILSSDNGSVVAHPQNELRILDPGNVVTAPEQAGQLAVEPAPTPSGAAQFTPTPVQAATPAQAPAPADVSTAVAPDPSPTSAAVADAAPAVPPAPAAAPVPPAPASAPPPAATEPVSNVGLAHGDSAAPTRGATRYAMVRNDEEQSLAAAMAMAGAGAIVAVFLCVMFVAPGASSKPKPRPRRAY